MSEERERLYERVEQLLEAQDREQLAALLKDEHGSDIAEIVEMLDPEHQRMVFDVLDISIGAEVLGRVDEATREELFEVLEDRELVELISELDPDDAADVLAELDKEESREVLESMDREDAEQIKELMVYSEDSAGGIMDPMVLSVKKDATVNEAIQKIREAEVDEDFYTLFVVDDQDLFLGEVRIRLLITSPANTKIIDLIDTDAEYVTTDTDQEEVRNLFKKYDLIVMPVLDANHRLVGRITADRVIEVAQEEAAEDMYAMAGTDATELESISYFRAARVRLTWLLPCLAGTAITAMVGFFFKHLYMEADRLAIFATAFLFAPMIAAISGNAGLQTSAIVVCGLATGDLAALRISQVFEREVRVALLVAVTCGILGGLICGSLPFLFNSDKVPVKSPAAIGAQEAPVGPVQGDIKSELPYLNPKEQFKVAVAFTLAMFSAIMVATTLGLFLPFLFRRVGLDPAISSGPLVTTANDSISVSIYLLLTTFLTHI